MKVLAFVFFFIFSASSFATLHECKQNSSGSFSMDYESPLKQRMSAVFKNLQACQARKRVIQQVLKQDDLPVQVCGCGQKAIKIGSVTSHVFRGACHQIEYSREFRVLSDEIYDSLQECEYYHNDRMSL